MNLPFSSTASTLAPFASSSCTTTVKPFLAATCRGLRRKMTGWVCRQVSQYFTTCISLFKKKKNIATVFHQHSHSIPWLWLTGDKRSRNTRNTYVCKAALVAFMRFLSVIFSNINKALVSCPCGKQRKHVAYLKKLGDRSKTAGRELTTKRFFPLLCTVILQPPLAASPKFHPYI